jgi:hypothetical protein
MIRVAIATVALAAALTAGGSTAQTTAEARHEAKFAKAIEGLTAGKPTSCIDRMRVSYIKTFPDKIVYVLGRNKKWVNETNGGCNGLKHDDIVVTKSFNGQLCRGDIVETRSRSGGMMTGACSLGQFVPYTR